MLGEVEAEADTDVNGDSSSTSSCVADGELEPVVEAGDDREPEGLADVIAGATDRSGESEVVGDNLAVGDSSIPTACVLDVEPEAIGDADNDEYPDWLAEGSGKVGTVDEAVDVVEKVPEGTMCWVGEAELDRVT